MCCAALVKPLGLAGVKVVGDFVDNYKQGLPSEMALLNLFSPTTGMPVAIIDATRDHRHAHRRRHRDRCAPSRAQELARARPYGARGTAY